MTEAPASFVALAEEMRALLVDERAAIVTLDHARLAWLAAQKQAVADQLARACREVLGPGDRDRARALQVEARANAMLAAAAGEAVRALLGRQSAGYDRRARRVTTHTGRALVAS
jgi:hypothetical protein